jgi:hypothetical protein
MFYRASTAASGLALSLFLLTAPAALAADGDRVDANGLPTDHSTPAEKAQTADLNNQIQSDNQAADAKAATQSAAVDSQTSATNAQAAANDAQYQQQQQQYQNQLQQNQQAQQDYQDRTAAYENLRQRYASERAAYHREVWPDRYRDWHLQTDAHLLGSRLEMLNGDHVGTVDSVARGPNGRIEALMVTMDGGKVVWIDEADVRFDRGGDVVMTDLDRADLHQMADERL